MKIYKEGAEGGMTAEQKKKWLQITKMGDEFRDVAKAYYYFCLEENETPEWKQRGRNGLVDGDDYIEAAKRIRPQI